MIAGYHVHTSAEHLEFGLRLTEDALLSRPGRLLATEIIHDRHLLISYNEMELPRIVMDGCRVISSHEYSKRCAI